MPMVVYLRAADQERQAVLTTIRPGSFGHEHMADRARDLLWSHKAYNRLPRHAGSLDVGAFRQTGEMIGLGDAEELFLFEEFVSGLRYATDLMRLAAADAPLLTDLARADALCDYLVEIHKVRGADPSLYERRIRELVGHGECIMGLIDSYAADDPIATPVVLQRIEQACLRWRWRLKGRTRRMRQVHGDFHPWNILFRNGTDFSVIDRSRGEWGDPADDVTCLTINYLFFELQHASRFGDVFEMLFKRFWERYLTHSGDGEMLAVAAPFFAFRGLVLANPLWYPDVNVQNRRKLFSFIEAVLDSDSFDPSSVNTYLNDRAGAGENP
jgi:aminoglycoside phosphotransferase (APT) family kinase protein